MKSILEVTLVMTTSAQTQAATRLVSLGTTLVVSYPMKKLKTLKEKVVAITSFQRRTPHVPGREGTIFLPYLAMRTIVVAGKRKASLDIAMKIKKKTNSFQTIANETRIISRNSKTRKKNLI